MEVLTSGGVDTLADYNGRMFELPGAQEPLRHSDDAKHATVLIVDNEIQNRKLLEAMLGRKGYSTLCAASGKEALAMIAQRAPDLILLDIVMPGMDGYQVARMLKANPATSNIPIIMVTAHTDRRTRLDGLNAGAEEFLTTPVDQSELWLRVRNLLRLKAFGDFLQDHNQILEQKVQARAADLQRFRTAMDATADGIFLVNRTTMRFVEVNATACNMLGYTREELFDMGPAQIASTTPEQLETVYDAIIDGDSPHKFGEIQLRRKDGSCLQVEAHRQAHRAGTDWLIVAVMRDITARQVAEHRITHLNRVYAVLSGINTLIVRVRDRDELFREACRVAVDAGGFRMAMICIVERGTTTMVPVASAGKDKELLAAITGVLSSGEHARKTMVALAIAEKKVVVSNDTPSDPRLYFSEKYAESGVRSMAILPLMIADEAVGVLALYASESEFFLADEMKLVTELADDIAFAIAHIAKEEKIARLSRMQAVKSSINAAMLHAPGREELFNEACRIAVEAGKFGLAWVGMLDPITQDVVPVAWSGEGGAELSATRSSARDDTPRGMGAVGRAIRERRAVFNNDVAGNAFGGPRTKQILALGLRSQITLPLLEGRTIVGTLTLYAKEPDFFVAEEITLLNELAADISFALDHIGKEEKIARLSRVKAVTSGINSLIVRVRDRQELFEGTCRIAFESGGFGIAWVGTFDPVTQDITPVAWAGIDAKLTSTRRSSRADIPEGQGLAGRAVREKTAVFDNDIFKRADSGGGGRKEAISRGYGSLVALPLLAGGAVLGTLSLFAREPGFFDADELMLLTELAGNISFAIEHISRQEKLDKLSRIRAVSSEINSAIVRISGREALLKEVCHIISDKGKFELVWIASVDADTREIRPVAWTGFSPDVAHAMNWERLNTGSSTLADVMQTRRPAVCNDIETAVAVGPLRKESLKRGCHSTVCLPLLVDDNVVAAINLFASGRNFFDADELALLNETASDISFALQSIARQEQLNYLAYYDALTGLANRILFDERLEQGVTNAKEHTGKLALVLLDIERFKTINDTLGRQAGDALLKEVAARMSRYAVDAGRLARIEADHFAVMVTDAQTAEELAHLIEQRIEEIFVPPFRIGDAELRVSAKFGIAMFPADGADADTLFKNAEAALENAKARGDRYLFYTQSMNERVAEKLSLENRLRKAIEREEFVLHYQPKVNLASGKLTSAEALIRWNDPDSGLVPPGRFIPILEETGMIYEVGRWALRQAIADYLRWRAAGLPAVRIAVNVSPLQLRNRGFVAEIGQIIGIDPHAAAGLELEITESVIMDDVEHNIEHLQAIRAMDVTIAIDDFGTGFSSLSYLAKLPVDTLKIDRAFIIDMTASPQGLALVSTIINLAHALKRKVVAEGVETEEQARLLRLLNCDEMQGYLFSKPVPGEIFESRFLALPVTA
jgi:diguanylate cyclase (GGDEF)-like protein/PAS domain S-box-containing protein